MRRVPAHVPRERRGAGDQVMIGTGSQSAVDSELVVVDVDWRVQRPGQGDPDVLIAVGPRADVENGVVWITRDCTNQFSDAGRFRRKRYVGDEGSVEIKGVKRPDAIAILDQERAPGEAAYKGRLAADVSGIEDALSASEHDGAGAVVGVEEGDADAPPRPKLHDGRRLQRQRLVCWRASRIPLA